MYLHRISALRAHRVPVTVTSFSLAECTRTTTPATVNANPYLSSLKSIPAMDGLPYPTKSAIYGVRALR